MGSFFVGVGVGGPVAVYEFDDCCCPGGVFAGTTQQVADEIVRLVRDVADEKNCEHQFKSGDVVECIDNRDGFGCFLTVGKTYKVIMAVPAEVVVEMDNGCAGGCYAWRFKKIDPPKPATVSRFKVGDKVRCRDFSGSWCCAPPLDSETVYEVINHFGVFEGDGFLRIDNRFNYDESRFVLASEVAEDDSDGDAGEWPLELEIGESYVDRVGGVWEVVHCENEYEYLDDSYDEDDEFYEDGWKFLAVNYDARFHGWFRENGKWICVDSDDDSRPVCQDLVADFDG